MWDMCLFFSLVNIYTGTPAGLVIQDLDFCVTGQIDILQYESSWSIYPTLWFLM